PARDLIAQDKVLVALLRPKHLLDRVLKRLHTLVDRGAYVKLADTVIQQIRRGGPETDQRRRPRITTTTGRHCILVRLTCQWIVPGYRADRRQILVRLRREVVPNVPTKRIGGKRTTRVCVQQRDGHAQFSREIVVFQEVVSENDVAHLRFEVVCLGPLPVFIPTGQVILTIAAMSVVETRSALRYLARVTTRTAFCEDGFAVCQLCLISTEVSLTTRR